MGSDRASAHPLRPEVKIGVVFFRVDRVPYSCILIATILSAADVEECSLAKVASDRAFRDRHRHICDDLPKRAAIQDAGGLRKSRHRA